MTTLLVSVWNCASGINDIELKHAMNNLKCIIVYIGFYFEYPQYTLYRKYKKRHFIIVYFLAWIKQANDVQCPSTGRHIRIAGFLNKLYIYKISRGIMFQYTHIYKEANIKTTFLSCFSWPCQFCFNAVQNFRQVSSLPTIEMIKFWTLTSLPLTLTL